ncbi:MAG TPA: SRPBCC family protein [Streptosporangiaceae bacterium]|nr:SRPBCC family protein [Streptosporangiaceae bacterium]
MELAHEFTVNTPIGRAWAVLTDIERIAPCMPGAELTEVDGDTYHGLVKVKVGPITAQYKGTASFVEKDEAAHRAVLKAAGRDARGQGNASAMVTAVMAGEGEGTRVAVTTDMTISGRVAQFGRGVMADVTAKLIQQFVDNLEATVLAPPGKGESATAGDAAGPDAAADGTGNAAAGDGGARNVAAGAAGAAAAAGDPPDAGAAEAAGPRPQTEGEPVRVVGLVLRSAARRTGQFFARLFHRLTGRHQG